MISVFASGLSGLFMVLQNALCMTEIADIVCARDPPIRYSGDQNYTDDACAELTVGKYTVNLCSHDI